MPKFRFRPEDLRRCFATAKVVKPQTNDLCIRFAGDRLIVFSSDRRRYVRAETAAEPVDKVPDGYSSEDFYITVDRSALFDSDLDSVTVNVNEKSLSVHTTSADQSRQASLKKRSVSSRRPVVPGRPDSNVKLLLDSGALDHLLKQVSCSAQIRDTKTEEDMRVNQVHLYGEAQCAVSNARYYGSVAFLPSLTMDASIVSSDVPVIRSFISKSPGGQVHLFQDSGKIYVEDSSTGSFLAMSKVGGTRPPLSLLDRAGFGPPILADQSRLSQSLDWAMLALEGTQRITVSVSGSPDDSMLCLSAGAQEISKIPVKRGVGNLFQADFPARFLASIVKYVGDGTVAMRFGHPDAPTFLEISRHGDTDADAFHYIQSMKVRQ